MGADPVVVGYHDLVLEENKNTLFYVEFMYVCAKYSWLKLSARYFSGHKLIAPSRTKPNNNEKMDL